MLPATRPYKRSDGKGLYLFITPAGSKFWRMNSRFEERQKTLSLGEYPTVSIKATRAKRRAAKGFLKDGVDPGSVMRRGQAPSAKCRADSFNAIADEFLEKRKRERIAETTLSKNVWLLDMARPALGAMRISEIRPADVLAVLKEVEARETYETAKRLRTTIGQVFRYAVATLRSKADPTLVLRGALIAPKVRNMPAGQ